MKNKNKNQKMREKILSFSGSVSLIHYFEMLFINSRMVSIEFI